MKKTKDEKILSKLLSGKGGKKYEGKQVVIFDGEVYILPNDANKSKDLLKKLVQRNPKATPTLTFVPKRGIYILLVNK